MASPPSVGRGRPARLIPADEGREMRAVSAVLGAVEAVGPFGRALLKDLGHDGTGTISCWTEVSIGRGGRADGLIQVSGRTRLWRALVEAKISNEEVKETQARWMIACAAREGLDAVLTITDRAL